MSKSTKMSDNEDNDENIEEYVCGYCNVDRRFGDKHEIGCENETDDENTESDDCDEKYEILYGCSENEQYIEKQCTRRHSV